MQEKSKEKIKFFELTIQFLFILFASVLFKGDEYAFAASCPVLNAGDMVKVTGRSAIYVINKDSKLLYFPTGDEFKSWNSNDSYGGYTTVTQECYNSELMDKVPNAYPAGVNFRPGSYIVKRASSAQLYVVLPGNKLAKISSVDAQSLYGASFIAKTINDVFWSNYIGRGDDVAGKVHEGMLIQKDGLTYYVDSDNVLRQVPTLTENRFKSAFIHQVPASYLVGFTIGAPISLKIPNIENRAQDLEAGEPSLPTPPPTPTPTPTPTPVIPLTCSDTTGTGANADYLIVTAKNLCDPAKQLRAFRRDNGRSVGIITIEDMALATNTAENIDLWIENYYAVNPNLKFVVLLGGSSQIPFFHFISSYYPPSMSYASDFNYSVISNNSGNYLPTFMVGRLPIKDGAEMTEYLRKVYNFEIKRTIRNDLLMFGYSPETNYVSDHSATATAQGFNALSQINPSSFDTFYSYLNNNKNIAFMFYYGHGNWFGNGPINIDSLSKWSNDNDPVVYFSGGCGFDSGTTNRPFSELMQFSKNAAVAAIGVSENGGYGYDYSMVPMYLSQLKKSASIGQVFKNTIIDYFNAAVSAGRNTSSPDQFDSYYVHRLILIGDPALKIR